ncbi:MAG: hypothetical protein CVU71_10990 [Deltaproteobacteria bacterium HGW-Deltaproteobacteria-6]|nr:MAG: hypothetical protein CVU71_10990 [Deltaproteobacteria bacterium HGW-Deltaproteobacteria-6]
MSHIRKFFEKYFIINDLLKKMHRSLSDSLIISSRFYPLETILGIIQVMIDAVSSSEPSHPV